MSDSLKIYADLISEPSRTVLGFCRLSGVAYEFVPVDLVKGEYLSEEYAAINPYQAVPAIAHGSYKLNESGAIISYIADAFNVDNHWYPKDIKIRGRIQAFIHWHHQALRERKDEYLVPKVVMPLIAGAAPPSAEDEVKMAGKTSTCCWRILGMLPGLLDLLLRIFSRTMRLLCCSY